MLRLELDNDIAEFQRAALPALECDAGVNSMLLGLVERQAKSGKPAFLLARAHRGDGSLAAAAVQTDADRSLVLSNAGAEDAAEFARALRTQPLTGVLGPLPSVDPFADARGKPKKLISNMRLFELRAVRAPAAPGGKLRAADSRDEDVLFAWLRAFHAEAVPHDPARPDDWLREDIRMAVAQSQFFLWESNGRPVCLVGSRRETAREKWIAPVYTPPEHRGRGYASALVAGVSLRILAGGKLGMLFTDLANPTSNSIYQKIGYEPVTDFRHYHFDI